MQWGVKVRRFTVAQHTKITPYITLQFEWHSNAIRPWHSRHIRDSIFIRAIRMPHDHSFEIIQTFEVLKDLETYSNSIHLTTLVHNINDFANSSELLICVMYADDTTIYCSLDSNQKTWKQP